MSTDDEGLLFFFPFVSVAGSTLTGFLPSVFCRISAVNMIRGYASGGAKFPEEVEGVVGGGRRGEGPFGDWLSPLYIPSEYFLCHNSQGGKCSSSPDPT